MPYRGNPKSPHDLKLGFVRTRSVGPGKRSNRIDDLLESIWLLKLDASGYRPGAHVGMPIRVDLGNGPIRRAAAFGDVPSVDGARETHIGKRQQVGGMLTTRAQSLFSVSASMTGKLSSLSASTAISRFRGSSSATRIPQPTVPDSPRNRDSTRNSLSFRNLGLSGRAVVGNVTPQNRK